MWRGQCSQIDHNVCRLYRVSRKRIILTWVVQVQFKKQMLRPLSSHRSSAMSQHLPCMQTRSRRVLRDRRRTEWSDVGVWLAIWPSCCLHTSVVFFSAVRLFVYLFVCQSRVLFRARPNEVKSPISHKQILKKQTDIWSIRLQMQDDVFRGLREWRPAALPSDMAKWRDLSLHEPGDNTAALQRKTPAWEPSSHTMMNCTNNIAYNTNQLFYLGLNN